MKLNLKSNLSTLSTISESSLSKVIDEIIWCICDSIENTTIDEDTTTEVDIGFGSLLINIVDNQIKYKFIPSKKFEQAILSTIIEGNNQLVNNLENSLTEKMLTIYKDLL